VTPPHFLISAGSHVPRVRVADANPATVADSPAPDTSSANNPSSGESTNGTEANEAPAVARFPGFLMDLPNR
jgi:hypothetical protein